MAEDSSESKTEAPTPKRLRQARMRGQVAKSTELSGALSLLCTLLCVIGMAPWAARQIADFDLAVDRSFEALTLPIVQAMVMQAMFLMAQLSLIPLGVAALVYLASLWLQTGAIFSLDLVKPMLERLNPVAGLRRLFSVRSLVQFALMLVKGTVIATAAVLVCTHMLGDAVRVIYADAGAALTVANAALMNLLLWCGGLFVLLGLSDLAYQRWQFLSELRMSSSEVRREHREDQGDGKMKSQIRGFVQEPVPREQLAFIHMASLVVCSTDGRVVVLVYRPKQYPLPLFMVRGSAEFAAEILAVAQQHKILTVTDSPLAAALYPAAHTGMPMPSTHLDAVHSHIQSAAA
jgi:flagellar biosynthesis protein FlhB